MKINKIKIGKVVENNQYKVGELTIEWIGDYDKSDGLISLAGTLKNGRRIAWLTNPDYLYKVK